MLLFLLACAKNPMPPANTAPPIDSALVTWLDANAQSRVFWLPLEITSKPLANFEAYIVGGGHRIPVELDSTALSMTLDMHLGDCCKPTGTVWVQGSWGALVPSGPSNGPVFTVRAVGEPVTGAPTHPRW